MKKYVFIFIIINCISLSALAQRGYYLKDNKANVGVRMVNDITMNFRYCQLFNNGDIIRLKPDQVEEYGFNNGPVYKAFTITLKSKPGRFFFERLLKGRVNLYSLNAEGGVRRLYVNGSDSIHLDELTKKGYKDVLEKYVGDQLQAVSNLKSVSYNEEDLIFFLQEYNDSTFRPLKRMHFGFRLGMDATRLSAVDNESPYSKAKYKNDYNVSVGAFLNVPLEMSNYSVTSEIYYKANRNTTIFDYAPFSYALDMDYASINIPVLLKYSFSNTNNSPYVLAGPLYSRIIKNETSLYQYEPLTNIVNTRVLESPVLGENMGGFSIGCGIGFVQVDRIGLFGEMRYNQLYNLGGFAKNLNFSELSLMIGVQF